MKHLASFILLLAGIIGVQAQTISVLPQMTPAGGNYEDYIDVTCTFPEGCAGGKYWFNGGEISSKTYDGPIRIEKSTRLSVAGVNNDGYIITDVLTHDFTINKVTEAFVTSSPEENTIRESFYVTTITWNNAESVSLDVTDFKEGGSRSKESLVWLTNDDKNEVIATGGSGALWANGNNSYKAYIYKDYRPTANGKYTLHIAGGVFTVNGKLYEKEIALTYYVGENVNQSPIFSPASGTYEGQVAVSIEYPVNVFYQLYKINGGSTQSYDGPITITETSTIEAWGRSEDFDYESEHSTASYVITEAPRPSDVLPLPIITRNANTITITEEDETAVIKYWFDDDMNTAKIYNAPFEVTKNGKLSVVAYRENGISHTVDYVISHFEEEASDFGTTIFRTPNDWQTVHITGMSPNGKFACGYTDTSGNPFAFIWDLTSGKAKFISNTYYCQALGVSNDGTAIGWRLEIDPITGEMISNESGIRNAYYKGNEWIAYPAGMTVNGITADNILYGALNGEPATYDIATGETKILKGGNGAIMCSSHDGYTLAGNIKKDGRTMAAYWLGDAEPVTIETEKECSVMLISGDGKWMMLDNASWGSYSELVGYRHNISTGLTETIPSMGAAYPSRYEWMSTITNDGTMFGVFDRSLMSHDAGVALAYTADGTWTSVNEILYHQNVDLSGMTLLSCKYVSANQDTFVMTVFPSDSSTDDAFAYAVAVCLNGQVHHGSPVSLEAQQMYGMQAVKLTWEAPVTEDDGEVSYKVMRNGELVAATTDCFYYDEKVEGNKEYTYTIIAVYEDGVESQPSFPATITVNMESHMAPRNLALRQSGINDVNLTWLSPIITMPKLQYFNEEGEFAAFGTAGFNSEWAIRIPASDLEYYNDMDIRTFQFLPTGPQRGYELRLYRGTPNSKEYETTPFYTQSISPDGLKYGTVNTIALDTTQPLPVGNDLIIGLYIEQSGNNNMLGISHDGFKPGYSDLCIIEGVYETFISIAEESSVTTEIVNPLGVGLGNEALMNASIVDKYEVSDNNVVLGSTSEILFRTENVKDGEHEFSVRAVYKDGEYSAPATIKQTIAKNEAAFIPVSNVTITPNEDNTATITWKAPLNDDRTDIHWGDMTPSKGMENFGYPVFMAASIFPVTMTGSYANDYEITHLFYYPTADAGFELILDNNEDEVYYDDVHEPVINQLNLVELPEPITVDQSNNYRCIIMVDNCPYGESPLAYDSSNDCADGYSNLVSAGNDWMTLSDVVQIDEKPSWLMGLVLRQKNARPMPLEGYDVIIDGEKNNDNLITDCSYVTKTLVNGTHNAVIAVVYDSSRTVKTDNKEFLIGGDGIETIFNDRKGHVYDLEGRRVISDKLGRGIFIIDNKKFTNK